MSELSDIVSDEPVPVVKASWASDRRALFLRLLILASAIGGAIETLRGLRDAWAHGVPVNGSFGEAAQQIWCLFPFALLLLISAMRISKRSLITLFVTTLLCWFMSTGYFNVAEMGMVIFVVPFIQLTFIAGALGVMFTFWLLRKRS